ncbi:thioredoxin domain-containing protein 5-like isoform X2 [Xenia sp. Carnegie-2017]|uniref:thioredoxin domain-containing protein 5-like isoform X2 n=1 Tax=Xenia sp. Carnegie-2017 TaxID=2897299 RepID=UPI001F04F066|nr:thioredoxin domain-containing protein 5-like isoform X2 [Xenia sp. Carnegie-2017]
MKKYLHLLSVLFFYDILETRGFADFLNVQTFRRIGKPQFVLFYAAWCKPCKQLLQTWNQLADKYHQEYSWKKVQIQKVNCLEDTEFCSSENIVAYPTMKLYHNGDMTRFDGRRNLHEFELFIDQTLNYNINIHEENGLLTLTRENFDAHIKQGNGLHFIDFYAPWCIHCRRFEPTWKVIAEYYKDNEAITIGKIDCTKETDICKKWELDTYDNSRDIESLKSYIHQMLQQQDLMNDSPTPSPDNVIHIGTNPYEEPAQDEGDVLKVKDSTFDALVKQGPIFINFFVPWSKESQKMEGTWKQLAELNEHGNLINIAEMDCTRYSEFCANIEIADHPTLILFKNGSRFRYNGEMTLEALLQFIKQHFKDEL